MGEHSFTDRRDPDGICSAAIMKRRMERLGLEGGISFIGHGYAELEDVFRGIGRLPEGSSVVFIDFGADERYLPLFEEAFGGRRYKVSWLDHHEWDDKALERVKCFADVVLAPSLEHCGAELAYRIYGEGDEVSEALSKIGRDSDIEVWNHRPPKPRYALTFPLADLITYYNYLSDNDRNKRDMLLNGLVDKLSSASVVDLLDEDLERPLWDSELEAEWKRYCGLKTEKLKECVRDAETCDIGKYSIVISRASDALSTSTAANHLLETFDVDASLVLYSNGSFTVRRRAEGIDCYEIARRFKGGGHEYAAGASVGFPIGGKDDLEKAKRLVIDKISKLRFFYDA